MAEPSAGATAFAIHAFTYPVGDRSDGHPGPRPLPHTAAAVATIRDVLAEHLPSEHRLDGNSTAQIAGQIERWLRSAGPDDHLILYLAGHGEAHGDDHFLVGADTDPNWVTPTTAVSADTLSMWLARTKANRVLVIIDSCYSGEAGAAITAGLDAYFRRHNPRPGFAVQVLTSAMPGERSPDGLFAETFHRVLHSEAAWGPGDAFIHTQLFVDAIGDTLEADHGDRFANSVQIRSGHRFTPTH